MNALFVRPREGNNHNLNPAWMAGMGWDTQTFSSSGNYLLLLSISYDVSPESQPKRGLDTQEVTIWSFARVVCRNVTLLDLIDLLDLLGCREIDLISPTLNSCKK